MYAFSPRSLNEYQDYISTVYEGYVGYGNFMSLSTILKVILWQSVLLLDALSVHGDNHRPVAIIGKTL
jgi:hypothetical protein